MLKNQPNNTAQKNPTFMGVGFYKSGVRPSADGDSPTVFVYKDYCTKKPNLLGVGFYKSGVDLLSHGQNRSTISAIRLNFSVRNGKRWTMMQ